MIRYIYRIEIIIQNTVSIPQPSAPATNKIRGLILQYHTNCSPGTSNNLWDECQDHGGFI